jgi:transposase-like protein
MQGTADTPAPVPPCPRCAATHIVRNGPTHSGKPSFRCRACGRRFVADPAKGPVPAATRELVLRLLGERLGLRAIARVTGVSRSWLQAFVNTLYEEGTPWEPGPLKKSPATW